MFGALDPAKILMILVIALIVLGPERLPKAARQLGSYWRTLTQLRTKLEQEFRDAVPDFKDAFPDMDLPRIPKNPRAAVSGFVTSLISPDEESADGQEGIETGELLPGETVDEDAEVNADIPLAVGSGETAEDHSHVSDEELASVTAAWQSAVSTAFAEREDSSTNGSTATDDGTELPPLEPPPEVEQRVTRDYAPLVNDVTMN